MFRHSQADLRVHFELPPPLVAHRAAADVEVLHNIVKGLAKVARSASQSLMTLDGVHKGCFEVYRGTTWFLHLPGESRRGFYPTALHTTFCESCCLLQKHSFWHMADVSENLLVLYQGLHCSQTEACSNKYFA